MKKGKRERMYQEEKRIDEERKKRKDVLGRKENRCIRKKREQMKKGKRERMYQEEKRIDEERKKRKDVLGRKENR